MIHVSQFVFLNMQALLEIFGGYNSYCFTPNSKKVFDNQVTQKCYVLLSKISSGFLKICPLRATSLFIMCLKNRLSIRNNWSHENLYQRQEKNVSKVRPLLQCKLIILKKITLIKIISVDYFMENHSYSSSNFIAIILYIIQKNYFR